MPSWSEVERAVPDMAAHVRARFDADRHKVLATLRADGSPRLSGIETTFKDGELWLGMMPDSRKALDLRRDSRLALHTPPSDPDLTDPDARISGRAVEVTDPDAMARLVEGDERHSDGPPEGHVFRVDVTELLLLSIGDPADHLVIETWNEDAVTHASSATDPLKLSSPRGGLCGRRSGARRSGAFHLWARLSARPHRPAR